MRRTTTTIGAILTLLICTSGSAQAQVEDEAARADVRSAVESYARALASGDSLAALALLHPDVVIYEGGHAETRAEYRSGHLRSDIAFASAVKRTVTADDIMLMGDAALYTSEYTAAGRFRNRDIDSHGTETMVLVRTAEGWKIRHIHWSSR
ncbi:MAG TPA: nuclear transport factor 2 family protein [Longimicrobiales bacterium]|nr:nuclear transport factor 2 family protein [Longimicrobiales bacterium]